MRIDFQGWDIDGGRRELRISSRSIPVEPLVFDVLHYLARHPRRVVSKEELLEEVWGGASVSQWAIARAIKEVRRAFRDNGNQTPPIRTVRGHGYELLSEPLEHRDTAPAPRARFGTTQVGESRATALDSLEALAEDVTRGRGQLVLISGEPGIGKSWLVDRLFDRTRRGPIPIVMGRGVELGPRGAMGPWIQALRALIQLETWDRDALSERTRRVLADVLPEVADSLDVRSRKRAVGSHARNDSNQLNFRLVGEVCALAKQAAGSVGVVIVLEDVHRADPMSLELLALLADELHRLPLLLVATLRKRDWSLRAERHEEMRSLAEHPSATVLELCGLDRDELRGLICDESGRDPSEDEIDSLQDRTAGNPFLALQLLRAPRGAEWNGEHLATIPDVTSISGYVLTRHLGAISNACRRFLELAAVAGREFDLCLVAEASGEQVGALADEARRAGLLETVGDSDRRMRFVHALIAECLIAQAPSGSLSRSHERFADALLAQGDGADVIAVAYHLLRADLPHRRQETVDRLCKAATRLRDRQAYREASRLMRAALDVARAPGSRGLEPQREVEIQLQLGEALIQSNDVVAGRSELQRVVDRAECLGQLDLVAHAALAFAGAEESAGAEPERIQLLEQAADAMSEGSDPLALRVRGRLAMALQNEASRPRRTRLALDALEVARSIEDPALLCDAIRAAHFALWTPENLPQRRAWATEQLELARTTGDSHRVHDAQMDLIADLLEAGDRPGVDAALSDHERLMTANGELIYAWHHAHYRVMCSLTDGDLERAERELTRASRLGARTGYDLARQWSAMQLFSLRWRQDRLAELAPLVEQVAENSALMGWRLASALSVLEAGDQNPAREVLTRVVVAGELKLPNDFTWLVSAVLTLELADRLGAEAAKRVTANALHPYADRHATLYGMLDWGPISNWL